MKLPTLVERALHQERVNFVITNRVPRRILTRFMGWFSRIEQPIVREVSIAFFGLFAASGGGPRTRGDAGGLASVGLTVPPHGGVAHRDGDHLPEPADHRLLHVRHPVPLP